MKYPIGQQDFEKMRNEGFVYVDKTRHIYELSTSEGYCFLGRQPRCGKSPLVTAMEAYFSGKRELFRGLAMEELEKDWTAYHVLHRDLNTGKYDSVESRQDVLDDALRGWEKAYGRDTADRTPALRFKNVVQRAWEATGRPVVILVDEYDKPLLQTFGKLALQDELRAELKTFYSVLKTQNKYIRFAFLTGVTKFGKVSVFSDLNNLSDISMDKRYADICGITEEEMRRYFGPAIHELAAANGMTCGAALDKLKEMYDGYRFHPSGPGIYNPFSLLSTFAKGEIRDYWFETGTPTFLVEALKKTGYSLNQQPEEVVEVSDMTDVDTLDDNPVPLLYQSGYLTITGYNSEFGTCRLGFPNKEVEKGFVKFLLPRYMPVREKKREFAVDRFVTELREGEAAAFMRRLQTFYAAADYHVAGKAAGKRGQSQARLGYAERERARQSQGELYFQNTMFIFFRLIGFYAQVEYPTSHGRADIVVKTKDYI